VLEQGAFDLRHALDSSSQLSPSSTALLQAALCSVPFAESAVDTTERSVSNVGEDDLN
jgi:hypothetical protein